MFFALLLLLLYIHPASPYTPSITLPSQPPKFGILIVDGFSPFHSSYLTNIAINDYSAGVVNALSPYTARGLTETSKASDVDEEEEEDYLSYVPPLAPDDLSDWLDAIPFPLVGVLCESDAGLDFSERLSCVISSLPQGSRFQHNGHLPCRRDKYLLNSYLSSKKIPTVQQTLCTSTSDVSDAYPNYNPPVIVKPPVGCASESVFLCPTLPAAMEASSYIFNQNEWGAYNKKNGEVLLQEFVEGREFAVDCVSYGGHHKEVAMWSYDKTDSGFGPFAYRGTSLFCPSDDPALFAKVCEYVFQCLSELDVDYGLTHTEVRISSSGDPLVVEVNCRQHNANVLPLCRSCVGYDAVEVLGEGYFGEEGGFGAYPDVQGELRMRGMIIHLQCLASGVVKSINGLSSIHSLPTCMEMDFYDSKFGVGCEIERTVDIRGDCGWAVLIGEKNEVERDYEVACEIMEGMFEVEDES